MKSVTVIIEATAEHLGARRIVAVLQPHLPHYVRGCHLAELLLSFLHQPVPKCYRHMVGFQSKTILAALERCHGLPPPSSLCRANSAQAKVSEISHPAVRDWLRLPDVSELPHNTVEFAKQ